MLRIRSPKDFLAGLIFIGFGALGLWLGRDYTIGTTLRMGPGYLPTVLSYGCLAVGGIVTGRSFALSGGELEPGAWRPLIMILAGVAAFGLLIEPAGQVIATIATVLVGGLASRPIRPLELCLLAAGLAIFCAALFVYALGLSIPMWPR